MQDPPRAGTHNTHTPGRPKREDESGLGASRMRVEDTALKPTRAASRIGAAHPTAHGGEWDTRLKRRDGTEGERQKTMEARVGLEPTNGAFAEPCLTSWLPRHIHNVIS